MASAGRRRARSRRHVIWPAPGLDLGCLARLASTRDAPRGIAARRADQVGPPGLRIVEQNFQIWSGTSAGAFGNASIWALCRNPHALGVFLLFISLPFHSRPVVRRAKERTLSRGICAIWGGIEPCKTRPYVWLFARSLRAMTIVTGHNQQTGEFMFWRTRCHRRFQTRKLPCWWRPRAFLAISEPPAKTPDEVLTQPSKPRTVDLLPGQDSRQTWSGPRRGARRPVQGRGQMPAAVKAQIEQWRKTAQPTTRAGDTMKEQELMARARCTRPSARKRVRPIIYSIRLGGLPARHRAGRRVGADWRWRGLLHLGRSRPRRRAFTFLGFFAPTLVTSRTNEKRPTGCVGRHSKALPPVQRGGRCLA